MPNQLFSVSLFARWVLSAATLVGSPALAQDEFIGRANALYADIKPELRSDAILLPAIAKLEPAPVAVAAIEQAILLPADAPAFAPARKWAEARPQQDALEALARATALPTGNGPTKAFGQPYGVAALENRSLVASSLYTELDEPPTLAAAQHLYLAGLDRLMLLVHVEATRRAADGDPAGAIDALLNLMVLGRQIADRQLVAEALWGYQAMTSALSRIRDVAYVDFRGGRALTQEQLRAIVDRLQDDRGRLIFARLKFPQAERIAGEQIIARVFNPRPAGTPRPEEFGKTLARLASRDLPLRLFQESARFAAASESHADRLDTEEMLGKVVDDWANRWSLDWFHPRMSEAFDYAKLNKTRFAVIDAAVRDAGQLFQARQIARLEVIGTRTALGALGHSYQFKLFATTITSVARDWIPRKEEDVYNPQGRRLGEVPPLQYFVPMRDTKDRFSDREEIQPHPLSIVTGSGQNFTVRLRDDTFILYSVGSDNERNWAERIQNTPKRVIGADYLLWPPIDSLYRQYLKDSGRLD